MNTQYCVPTALSILMNIPYEDSVHQIEQFLGDVPITGVYMPVAVKILRDNGFIVEQRGQDYQMRLFQRTKGIFLVEISGHALVIKDGIKYDNHFPSGTPHLTHHRCLRVYEITKC